MNKLTKRAGLFLEKHTVPSCERRWGGMRWDIKLDERLKNYLCLEAYGYKVFSQNDEDGIIQEIFDRIGRDTRIFVEFGVQNGLECNTHLLLLQGWRGMFIEGSETYYQEIVKLFYSAIKEKKLKTKRAFINQNNINQLISEDGFKGEIDLLSIDIDGNDYYVWNAIDCVNPRVVVIEYNAKIPPNTEWVMPYKEDFIWNGDDFFGASLKSLEKLGLTKGYQLVGTNITGSNAFFVRKDLVSNKFYLPADAESLYNPARYYLSFLSGHKSCRYLGSGGVNCNNID